LTRLSQYKDGPIKAVDYLAKAGIKLVIEPHLAQTHLDGGAFLVNDIEPVIGMTLRFDRIDNFWFVLLHELAHILLHLSTEDLDTIFDDLDGLPDDVEKAADSFAGNALIPDGAWETAIPRFMQTKASIDAFASDFGIHPAIVAGKIRNESDNYMILADMVGQGQVRCCFPDVHFA
jgi:HTH-type transcriptional regulator/antitoxin HigA